VSPERAGRLALPVGLVLAESSVVTLALPDLRELVKGVDRAHDEGELGELAEAALKLAVAR
jgi:hypothetical protein